MDTEERLIAPNDYRYALNCRIQSSDGDNVGIVENLKGNQQINNLIDDPKYKVIGSYEDKSTHALFYFVCDTEDSNHKIISNLYQGTWYILAEGSYLNFNKNFLITGVNLVIDNIDYPDGILYWTDDLNEPRKIDVRRAFNFTNSTSLTPRYDAIDSNVIKSILPPPTYYPICTLGRDKRALDVNYIKRHIWQFKYRWVYKNNGKSAWSPISDISMTRTGTPDRVLFNLEEDNIISIRVNTGSHEVKSIEISVRKSDFSEDFNLIKTIDKDGSIYKDVYSVIQTDITSSSTYSVVDDNFDVYYIFKNNELTTPLPLQETNRLFDDVPLLAKSQELIDGNRLVYGNIVNGYDSTSADVDFEVVYEDFSQGQNHLIKPSTSISSFTQCVGNANYSHTRFKVMFDFSNIDFNTIPNGANMEIELKDVSWGGRLERRNFLYNPFCNEKSAEWWGLFNIPNVSTTWSAGDDINDVYSWMKSNCSLNFQGKDSYSDNMTLTMWEGYDSSPDCDDPPDGNIQQQLTDNLNVSYSSSNTNSFNDFWSIDASNQIITIDWTISNTDDLDCIGFAGEPYPFNANFNITNQSMHLNQNFAELTISGGGNYSMENNSEFFWITGVVDESRAFKSGAEHGFGIVYYDRENRSSSVNKCPEVFIPFNLHRNAVQNPTSGANIHQAPAHVKFQINHQAPDWATHFQFVYTGTRNIEKFVQFNAEEFVEDTSFIVGEDTVLPDSVTAVETSTSSGAGITQSIIPAPNNVSVVKLNVGSLIQRKGKTGLDEIAWTWQKGDRLRFIEYPNHIPGTDIIDFEIIGIDEDIDGSKLWYVLDSQAYDELNGKVTLLRDKLVEVYRPNNKEQETFYYEFGHMNPVINGNHIISNHSDNEEYDIGYYYAPTSLGASAVLVNTPTQIQDFNNGQPAIGYFKSGDVYHRPRETYSTSGYASIEDGSFSDYFKSNRWGKGRPNAFLPDFKQTKRHSTIFYSEPYISNTNINGLSTFYPDVSFQEYDKRFNSIQKLHSINDSLIIFQEDKVSRAMVSRDIIFDASGEQNVAISKNVLSAAVPYIGEYGICENPESFAAFGFRTYFFDIRRGAVMRLSQDGLTPISEARMKNFFTDYCEEVMDNRKQNKFHCYGVYDDKFDEYVISAPNIQWAVVLGDGNINKLSIPGFTVGFNDTSKKWNSFYSYMPDWLESFNTGIVSWKDGTPYQHNVSSSGYNTFYNVPYASRLDFPSNISPGATKVYNNIAEESTDIWEVEINTRNGQNTTVTTQEFTNGQSFVWEEGHGTKENIHHAVIKGDLNSSGGKIEGDRIRDTSIMSSLTLPVGPSQEENTLFSIKFGITPSGSPDLLGNV